MAHELYDPNNIFARILRGEVSVRKLYEDEFALAFPDINPKAPTHVLVIPKGAYLHLSDFTARATGDEITGYIRAVGHMARLCGAGESGYRLISNCGAHSGQEVPHLHVHILAGKPLGPLLSSRE